MSTSNISDERLNLFIDKELDVDDMNEIHQILLHDKILRERVCQLKAVRELVGYAYSEVPVSRYEKGMHKRGSSIYRNAVAASVILLIGVFLGWGSYQYSPNAGSIISAENAFQYVANQASVDHEQRNFVLHIDSGDVKIVNAALNEADHLLATYRNANLPMKLDIVTNKTGINILRPDVSPYIERIKKMAADGHVTLFACQRSIAKASKQEGVDIIFMPGVNTDKSARDLIPDRLKDGWVYIKA
ncbi:MAG: hypothetical protein OEZ15_05165 [Gammaproteobacteria bacterium]|nr:hypothetical protein [Gammaproteobacteria bacterium]